MPYLHRRRGLISSLIVLALAVATGAAGSLAAGATSAGGSAQASGHVLLTYVASNGGICLIRRDGSHPVRLTARWKSIASPTWSPRGRYLAFGRPTGPEQSKIFVANAHGQIRWRFGVGHFNGGPLWSPDGSHIAYSASWAHVYGLEVARMNGLDDHGVAGSPPFPTYGPGNPTWVPGGQRLAFDDGNFVDTPQGIFTVVTDGSDRRLLIGNARQPAFSPDGSKLAYVAYIPWQFDGLFVAEADGSNPRVIAPLSGQLSWSTPAWSPDGRRLAFNQSTLLYGRVAQTDLIVVRADGSGERVLAAAAAPAGMSAPVWSPGGKFVAFVRYPSGAIVVARADGGGQRVVVARSNGTAPAWRPAVALPAARRPPCPRR
jgi:Tol biopolymer transport system component